MPNARSSFSKSMDSESSSSKRDKTYLKSFLLMSEGIHEAIIEDKKRMYRKCDRFVRASGKG
jgi:hypothetical protein